MAAHLLMAAAVDDFRSRIAEDAALSRFVSESTSAKAPVQSTDRVRPGPPPALAVRAILRKARALIAAGWCQNADAVEHPGGPVEHCAVGAVRAAAAWGKPGAFNSRLEPAVEAAASVLLESTGEAVLYRDVGSLHGDAFDTQLLSRWNDNGERTQAEVITAFDRAIDAMRGAGARNAPGERRQGGPGPRAAAGGGHGRQACGDGG